MSKKISQLPRLIGSSASGLMPLALAGVTYAVVQGIELQGLTESDKATAQANGNAIAAANTLALQNAVTAVNAVGGGCIQIPAGDYWFDHGSLDVNVACQLSGVSNVAIAGVGVGATHLHIVDGAEANMFNLTGAASYITIRDLSIDGNRANQSLGVSGIRGDAFSGLWLQNLHVHDIYHYGIGFQGFVQEFIFMDNIKIENVGGDGFDQKNRADSDLYQCASNIEIRNFGLNAAEPTQAGWDCRGAWQLSNFVIHFTATDGSGIRFRQGDAGEPDVGFGGHRSHLSNFEIYGPGAASTASGIECVARDVHVKGGYIRDALYGVQLPYDGSTLQGAERCSFDSVTTEACGTAGFLTTSGSGNNTFTDCTATGGLYGFRIRSASCRLVNPTFFANTTAGISLDTTATFCEIVVPKGNAAGAIGLDVNAADCTVTGGDVSGCNRNLSVTAARLSVTGTLFRSATTDNVLVAVGGDDASFVNCTSRNATSEGYQLRAARTTVLGGRCTNNGGLGLQTEATATGTRWLDVYMAGNTADFDDQGTNTTVRRSEPVAATFNEAVAATASSTNIDVPILPSTTVTFVVEVNMEDSASARCTLRSKVQAYRSAAGGAVVSAGVSEFSVGAGLTLNLSASGNNLRVSATKSAGTNCRLDTRVWEISRGKTVEFS